MFPLSLHAYQFPCFLLDVLRFGRARRKPERSPGIDPIRIELQHLVESPRVVGGVAGNHQAYRRDVQTGRVVSVGMADFHHDQVVPFEIDLISLEFFGDHEAIRNLAWKQRVPEVREDVRRGLLAHEFHNIARGHRPGIGKTIEERSNAKEMVAVTVGDINRCQVLAARPDPIYEDVRLLDGDKGVDEDGVSLAGVPPLNYSRSTSLDYHSVLSKTTDQTMCTGSVSRCNPQTLNHRGDEVSRRLLVSGVSFVYLRGLCG